MKNLTLVYDARKLDLAIPLFENVTNRLACVFVAELGDWPQQAVGPVRARTDLGFPEARALERSGPSLFPCLVADKLPSFSLCRP